MTKKSEDNKMQSVLELLQPPKGTQNWHGGPTLRGSLKGVGYKQAMWKPAPGRHSIWELTMHIAYWKYAVRRYLDPDAEKGFARSPANWPEIETAGSEGWKADKKLLDEEHDSLLRAIEKLPAERLDERINPKKNWTFRQLIAGIAAHDTYHIGQIQLMKRLYKELN